ncbi:glycosyltransferase family 2 protein [Mesorhizobium shangrilense]|uniref:Glycosyltransferase family A protein n=1 Tax=Mesorhizobium shangrilense TaxID=460060 RepID=A0ABV2D7G2_9HYPH
MAQSIAACIPLYNGQKFIRTSLKSVLGQSRQPDEVMVVDDGSTDNGADIAREITRGDDRIKVLTKQNGGQSSARNLAVKSCDSDLIAFLDQDDWWYPRHLETLEAATGSEPQVGPFGWVYSDLDEYSSDGHLVVREMIKRLGSEHPKRTIYSCLSQNMYVLPSASLISREAFEAVGGFDENLSGYEDDDLFLRLFRAGYTNTFVGEALSAWRIHSASASYSTRMAKSALIYADKLLDAFPDDIALARYYSRDLITPRFFHTAAGTYRMAGRKGSIELASDALALMDRLTPTMRFRLWLIMRTIRPLLGNRFSAKLASTDLAYGFVRRLAAI